MTNLPNLGRYARQVVYPPLGLDGQKALARAAALIVGVGGLGSHLAELLARAGVGRLRLVDSDRVDLTNLHRQALYDQADAEAGRLKVDAAAARIATINSDVHVEAVAQRLDRHNINALASGMNLLIDGTDSFGPRFIINDYCVQQGLPWVFGGVVGAQGQVMTIVPGRSACLRCVLQTPPPACTDPNCREAGVLGPAVAIVAAHQASEAIKILSGHADSVSPHLLSFDLQANTIQRLDASRPVSDCPCCGLREFEYLEP